jgi:Protein of unknown function (DUF1091)
MALKLLFLLFLIFVTNFVTSQDKLIKVRSFKCTSSNQTIHPNFKCFAKSYSRTFSAIFLDCFFRRPLCNVLLTFSISKLRFEIKHGGGITPYYHTFINSTVHFCETLNGTDSNPIANWAIEAISHAVPKGFFHPCPYIGQFTVRNVSIATVPVFSQFLSGRYKTFIRVFDESDDNILTLQLETEMKTLL